MSGIPKNIGKYQILKLLGKGAMGLVYLGRDPAIERLVAVKIIANLGTEFGEKKEVLQRFINEARSAGRLRHPNIITIFDANIESNLAYIVMDYVQGKGLDQILKEQGKIHPQNVLFYLKQLASALDLAKEKGVLHRDIKPSNMMVDVQEQVYLLDFGVASLSDQIVSSKSVVGTPAYMSPEQILNRPLDHRSDLFSFAIVAFQLFSGTRPFPGDNYQEVLYNIVNNPPLSATDFSDVPASIDDVFAKALAKNRDDRYQTATEFFKEILKCFKLHRIEKPRGIPQANWRDFVEDKVEMIEKRADFSENKNNISRLKSNNIGRTEDNSPIIKKFIILIFGLCLLVLLYAFISNYYKKQKTSAVNIQDSFEDSDMKIQVGDSDYLKFSTMSDEELKSYILQAPDEAKLVEALGAIPERKNFDIVGLAKALMNQDSYLVKSQLIEVIVRSKAISAADVIKNFIDDFDPIVRRKAIKACVDLELKVNLPAIKLRRSKEVNNEVLKVIDLAVARLS